MAEPEAKTCTCGKELTETTVKILTHKDAAEFVASLSCRYPAKGHGSFSADIVYDGDHVPTDHKHALPVTPETTFV